MSTICKIKDHNDYSVCHDSCRTSLLRTDSFTAYHLLLGRIGFSLCCNPPSVHLIGGGPTFFTLPLHEEVHSARLSYTGRKQKSKNLGQKHYRVISAHLTPRFGPSQRVSKHTLMDPAPSLPALFRAHGKRRTVMKLPPQLASFYNPRRNSNFWARGKRSPRSPLAASQSPYGQFRIPKNHCFFRFFELS